MNRAAWILFLAFAWLGCPKRLETSQVGAPLDAQELLARTSKVESQVVSVRGEGRLRVEGPNSRSIVTVFVAAARPAFLHFEVLGFFGQPQAILATDGRMFALLQNDQGKYFHGPASPENVSRLLPVVLSGQELVSILLGAAPRIRAEQLSAQPLEAQAYLVTLWQADGSQKLWIHPRNYRALKSEMRGASRYDLLFENFEAIGSIDFPRKITLFSSTPSAMLELRYQDLRVNPDLEPSLFQLAPPSGAKVIELDENGQPRASL